MAFSGWSENGEPTYDTKDAAIERAKQMRKWDNNPDAKIMVQKYKWMPSWFMHIFKDTCLEKLVYYEVKD